MPQLLVTAAIGSAIATGIAVATGITASVGAFFLASFLITTATGIVGMVLAPDQKMPLSQNMRGRDQMLRQPNAPRKLVYGNVKVSGPVVYMQTVGKSEI